MVQGMSIWNSKHLNRVMRRSANIEEGRIADRQARHAAAAQHHRSTKGDGKGNGVAEPAVAEDAEVVAGSDVDQEALPGSSSGPALVVTPGPLIVHMHCNSIS